MGFAAIESGSEVHQRVERTRIEVFVLFTDVHSTLSALRTAAQLADGLCARIRLLVLQCVPYPLPLDKPSVSLHFLGQRFRTLAESCHRASHKHEIETFADIRFCRDPWQSLQSVLAPQSVVVIGKRSRWWPMIEDRLARKLRAVGHHVVRTSIQKDNHHA